MDNNIAIQYTIVGLIVLGALIWLFILLYRSRKKGNSGCIGCGLSEICNDKRKNHKRECDTDK